MHIYVLKLSFFLSRTEALSQNIFVGKYKQWYMYTSCLHDDPAEKKYHFFMILTVIALGKNEINQEGVLTA